MTLFRAINLVTLLILLLATLVTSTTSTAAETSESCRQKLIKAQQLYILSDLDWKPPREPKVVVGKTFPDLPFNAKEGFVRTVNCFLMTGKNLFVNFDLLDELNHRAIGRWENGRLIMQAQ